MGVDQGGRERQVLPEFGAGDCPPDFVMLKILSTILLIALQCRKCVFASTAGLL